MFEPSKFYYFFTVNIHSFWEHKKTYSVWICFLMFSLKHIQFEHIQTFTTLWANPAKLQFDHFFSYFFRKLSFNIILACKLFRLNAKNCFLGKLKKGFSKCSTYLVCKTLKVYYHICPSIRNIYAFRWSSYVKNSFCPLLKRGLLEKERICSLWEQILSYWSRSLLWRDSCRKANTIKKEITKQKAPRRPHIEFDSKLPSAFGEDVFKRCNTSTGQDERTDDGQKVTIKVTSV